MRFMMLMIPKGYETAAPGSAPPADRVGPMMKYNEELQKAGVLLALDGLHPPSMGARVSFAGGKPLVTDGPFTEAKEVLGGRGRAAQGLAPGASPPPQAMAGRLAGSPNQQLGQCSRMSRSANRASIRARSP